MTLQYFKTNYYCKDIKTYNTDLVFKVVCFLAQHTNFNHSISDRFTWKGAVNIVYVSIPAWDKATLDKVFTSGHWLQLCGQKFSTWQPVSCHNLTVSGFVFDCACVQISHVVFHTTESHLMQQFHQTPSGRVRESTVTRLT